MCADVISSLSFYFFLRPQSLFPLEKQQEAETDEDEDTAANSAQLAEWDGVEPPEWRGGVEEPGGGAEDGDKFGDFDGVNGGGKLFSPEREDVVSKASPRYVCVGAVVGGA